jgi:hypothetical protein
MPLPGRGITRPGVRCYGLRRQAALTHSIFTTYVPVLWSSRSQPQSTPRVLAALRDRLTGYGKCPMVIVGTAMRKLINTIFGVLESGNPFDPCIAAAA